MQIVFEFICKFTLCSKVRAKFGVNIFIQYILIMITKLGLFIAYYIHLSIPSINKLMNKSEIDSPSHSPNPLALSVKSHTYYKDSIIADLFEHFCKPMLFSSIIEQATKKCVVVCSSIKQAKKLHESEYLVWRSVLIQSDEDRRQKIRKNRIFQENSEIKCLISNHLSNLSFRDIYVNLLLFASPPKNVWIYNETVSKLNQLEYIVVCYNTREIQDTQLLEKQLKNKFSMLTPPDISSQQSASEEEQPVRQVSKRQETRMGQKTKPSCSVYRSPKPYTPNRVHQKPQQIISESSRNQKMTSRNVNQPVRSRANNHHSEYSRPNSREMSNNSRGKRTE